MKRRKTEVEHFHETNTFLSVRLNVKHFLLSRDDMTNERKEQSG